MTLEIPAMQGAVQIVMTVDTLEVILSRFPRLEVIPVLHDPDDLPTYAFRDKKAPRTDEERPLKLPRVPRRRPIAQ